MKTLNTEQENLLTLLTEMEQKLKLYKTALRERGFDQLSDSSDHDDDNDDNDTEEQDARRDDEHHQHNHIVNTQPISNHSHNHTHNHHHETEVNQLKYSSQHNGSDNDLYDEHNRISQIIQSKNLSGETSENSKLYRN